MDCFDNLHGIIPALITPFDDGGTMIPERALPLIERLVDKGVRGFYVGGSTGEGFLQSLAERREYLRFVHDATKHRVTLIAHVGALTSQDAWTLTEHAAEIGYDYVSSTPPFYYLYTEHEVLTYYRELAERSPLPVLLYNAPHTTGRMLSLDTQIRMLNFPNVIGSKHTDNNFFTAERLIGAVSGAKILVGPDEMLTAGLAMGMAGGIGSTYNLMPNHFLDIYRCVTEQDLKGAQASQSIVNEVISELLRISPSVIPGIKFGLRILGYDNGAARKPFQAIDADTKHFERLLTEAGGF